MGPRLQAAHALPWGSNQKMSQWGPEQGPLMPECKGSTGAIICLYRHLLRSPESCLTFTGLRSEAHGGHRYVLSPSRTYRLLPAVASLCRVRAALGRLDTFCCPRITRRWGKAASAPSWSPRLILCSCATLWGRGVCATRGPPAWDATQMVLFPPQHAWCGFTLECPQCVWVCLPPWLPSSNAFQSFIYCQAQTFEIQKPRVGFTVLRILLCHPFLRKWMRNDPAAWG